MPEEMSNCTYNVHKQLVKRMQFLHHADRYMKESKEDAHPKCEAMWHQIVENEKKNVRMLQEAVKRDREAAGL
ncbi:MAG: hypothetical protein M1160_02355 [Candidatus Marsarchaeota archaeon]|jgi:hypothetical protein|nr:hypothetical protein [Candidatus Marsarchaeota archaeon]MCL5111702.1 hypothetical protein [Candidatus Marsarchaeota archaeon]